MGPEVRKPGEEFADWKAPETGVQTPEESERIENPELAEVMAEYEANTRANIEKAKEDGRSAESIADLELRYNAELPKVKERYQEAMEVADKVMEASTKSENGWEFSIDNWKTKSGDRLVHGQSPRSDVLRAIDYRRHITDENGQRAERTFNIKGQEKRLVSITRGEKSRSNPENEKAAKITSINFKLVDKASEDPFNTNDFV